MRNHKIDILKGFAAISVIAGHAVQRGIVVGYNDHILYKLIYTFHMPLFMLLSGYVFFISTKEYNWYLIWKKVKRLIIPTFVWSYLLFFIKDFTFTGLLPFVKFPDTLEKYTQLLIKRPEFVIWFLYIVFINMVIITLGKMYFKKIFIIYLIIIYLMIFQSNVIYFGIHRLKVYMPIFIVGYYIPKYKIFQY